MEDESFYRWSPFQLNDDELTRLADVLLADGTAPFPWRMAAALYKQGSETGKELLIRIVADIERLVTRSNRP